MTADYCWNTKKKEIILDITHNEEREQFYSCYCVHGGFHSTVILLNDLMKILVGLGIFNYVIFKDSSCDCSAKLIFPNHLTNVFWFTYKM